MKTLSQIKQSYTKEEEEAQAYKKAVYIVSLVQDTMSLENQGLDQEVIEEMIEETKQELLTDKYKDRLWDK